MHREKALTRVGRAWRAFRRSLLYVPTLVTLGAILLFALTSLADAAIGGVPDELSPFVGGSLFGFLIFGGSASAASSLLSSIAGTWATIAGVVYSVTLVTIQLSATKYSAQVIPTFERDRFNQFVLGVFTGTFVYALLVLKTVRTASDAGSGRAFAPLLGVNLAILLAVGSLFLLIAFIANLTAYIRPTRFVDDLARVGCEALECTREPETVAGYAPARRGEARAAGEAGRAFVVRAERGGYVAGFDWKELRGALSKAVREAEASSTRARVHAALGERVSRGAPLLRLEGLPREVGEAAEERLRRACRLDDVRDAHGDPLYAAETLADIGVTALSGGSTDVGVAKSCLRGLARLMRADFERPRPVACFAVDAGAARVWIEREVQVVYAKALTQVKRVLDKAAAQGLWDVIEDFGNELPGLALAAERAVDDEAWPDFLEWLEPVARAAFQLEDAAARDRIFGTFETAAVALAREGRAEASERVLDLAREARAAGEAPEEGPAPRRRFGLFRA